MPRVLGALLLLTLVVSTQAALTLEQLAEELMNTQRLIEQIQRTDQASGIKTQGVSVQGKWTLQTELKKDTS